MHYRFKTVTYSVMLNTFSLDTIDESVLLSWFLVENCTNVVSDEFKISALVLHLSNKINFVKYFDF